MMEPHLVYVLLAAYLASLASTQVYPDSHYAQFGNDHTMIKYQGFGIGCGLNAAKTVAKAGNLNTTEKAALLKAHNDRRRKVAKGLETEGNPGPQPSASNMLEMIWDDELAAIAQRWANQCPTSGGTPPHDTQRRTALYTWVGQNTFKDQEQNAPAFGQADPDLTPDVEKAFNLFYIEVKTPGFNKNNINPFSYQSGTGHYTQLLWADSSKVGCGFLMLREEPAPGHIVQNWDRYLVCNYGPGGNINGLQMYDTSGAPGSKCPAGTTNNDGLCSLSTSGANPTVSPTGNSGTTLPAGAMTTAAPGVSTLGPGGGMVTTLAPGMQTTAPGGGVSTLGPAGGMVTTLAPGGGVSTLGPGGGVVISLAPGGGMTATPGGGVIRPKPDPCRDAYFPWFIWQYHCTSRRKWKRFLRYLRSCGVYRWTRRFLRKTCRRYRRRQRRQRRRRRKCMIRKFLYIQSCIGHRYFGYNRRCRRIGRFLRKCRKRRLL